MIVKHGRGWLAMLFQVQGSSLAQTFPRILVITGFSSIVTTAHIANWVDVYSLTVTPFQLIGVALGIFLGFRNNAAYDRYWEGRKLWGSLVNTTRSFTRQVTTLINSDQTVELRAFQQEVVYKTIGYVHALRHHLRNTDDEADIRAFFTPDDLFRMKGQKNRPLFILRLLGERIRWAWREGWIHDYHMNLLEGSLESLTNIQGACERIKNTPIPFAYTILMHRIVAIYCFALPFGILDSVGALTPVVVLLISHAFFGLDDIGDEIEDPFGTEPQHLPLFTLCRTIEVNLLQYLDETNLPPMIVPVDDILA
ncbi:bestrophin family protein [Lignipirellula cremea]|uniref:Bestrophin, RFP-TM, chloride channel n=1 Tax=Lignipirellula cremea TaxID=2528010 RepID=A0A518E114_9BACT|nr:bestrophin family ion channel [Lignipirellula cremea]QDU97786.1 Bestrophin, RFP-TM, chloride channel [Lignipirellula cremea]